MGPDLLREQIERLLRQQGAIVHVAREAFAHHDVREALREITQVSATTLGVERASVWMLSPDRRYMRCLDLYELSKDSHGGAAVLSAEDYPGYFGALESGRAIDAHDACTDPRTCEFKDGYLVPLGITSMMDAAVRQEGTVIGVVCAEHVGPRRSWTTDEVTFAGALADQVALVLAWDERRRLADEREQMRDALLHAQKLESLAALAGGIAHDFNNLLGMILGNATLARDGLEPEGGLYGLLTDVVEAAQRAERLTRQLLVYSGRARMETKPIDLNQQLETIRHLVEASTSPRRVPIHLQLETALPAVEGDVGQIEQVLMNLLLNAVEACATQGEVRVRTGLTRLGPEEITGLRAADARPGRYVRVTVADSGCGMPPDVVARVFDPFFSTKGPGRGLGLSAVAGIVKRHLGVLDVWSAERQGTTFELYLPASDRPAPGPQAEEPATTGEGTVLLIDDEAGVRTLYKRVLEHYGYRVVAAATGPEGIELFRAYENEVRLVILDLTMPAMSGVEAFDRLRAEGAEVPVLLTSGYDEHEATQGLIDRGLAGFLRKPATAAELVAKVQAILGGRP